MSTPRPVVWRGQVRGTSHAQVWSIESAIEDLIAARTVGEISDAYGQTLDGCRIERYERDGPRRTAGSLVVQPALIHFLQLTPVS